MPSIIDYPIVLERMTELKLRSLYYNSGAFGFEKDEPKKSVGWIGPPDGTIKATAREYCRQVAEPYEENLAKLLLLAWQEILPGKLWIMPASHWAHELNFGSSEWLPTLLSDNGIDPALLKDRNNAAAIEFSLDESSQAGKFVKYMLEDTRHSDFYIVFPNHRVTCLLHQHTQLWWTSAEQPIIDGLKALVTSRA